MNPAGKVRCNMRIELGRVIATSRPRFFAKIVLVMTGRPAVLHDRRSGRSWPVPARRLTPAGRGANHSLSARLLSDE
jgi:hypothetical protein